MGLEHWNSYFACLNFYIFNGPKTNSNSTQVLQEFRSSTCTFQPALLRLGQNQGTPLRHQNLLVEPCQYCRIKEANFSKECTYLRHLRIINKVVSAGFLPWGPTFLDLRLFYSSFWEGSKTSVFNWFLIVLIKIKYKWCIKCSFHVGKARNKNFPFQNLSAFTRLPI